MTVVKRVTQFKGGINDKNIYLSGKNVKRSNREQSFKFGSKIKRDGIKHYYSVNFTASTVTLEKVICCAL